MKSGRKTIPHIGMRIIKSAFAVGLCFFVSYLRGNAGIVFYSQLAAIWCMQAYVADTKNYAILRTTGTVVGALYGLVLLLLQQSLNSRLGYPFLLHANLVSVFIALVLYTTVLLHKQKTAFFSCAVFLSIVVNHINEANPYLFVWNRFLDTMIGIVIGIGVNSLALPRHRQNDILFISELDNTLFDDSEQLTSFSKAELNRMLDDGIHFTISTVRTPAMIADMMRDIRLKLPVIAMDGAVLYDIVSREYKKVYIISKEMAANINRLFSEQKVHCFVNVIIDDLLVIYYGTNIKPAQKALVEKLRRSPYRNYVNRALPENEDVVYFMVYEEKKTIEALYDACIRNGFDNHLKIIFYDSIETPGYAYLKIYNKNASKQNMIAYLKEEIGIQKSITFGSDPEQYDIAVNMENVNKTVQTLKKLYEPIRKPKELP